MQRARRVHRQALRACARRVQCYNDTRKHTRKHMAHTKARTQTPVRALRRRGTTGRLRGGRSEPRVGLYSGKTTVAGNSTALRVEARFFHEHPEFGKGAGLRIKAVAPGVALVSLSGVSRSSTPRVPEAAPEFDPAELAFLAFLERGMEQHPERAEALDAGTLAEAERLTAGVTP